MKKLLSAVALIGMLLAPTTVRAQVVGGAAAYHTDLEAIGIGAYFTTPLASLHENISISGNAILYFPDDPLSAFEVNGDLIYSFPVSDDSPVLPFALAGINIFRTSIDTTILGSPVSVSSTDIGLNLGGGVVFPAESVRPFAAAKFEIQDGTGFVLLGGIGFPIG